MTTIRLELYKYIEEIYWRNEIH